MGHYDSCYEHDEAIAEITKSLSVWLDKKSYHKIRDIANRYYCRNDYKNTDAKSAKEWIIALKEKYNVLQEQGFEISADFYIVVKNESDLNSAIEKGEQVVSMVCDNCKKQEAISIVSAYRNIRVNGCYECKPYSDFLLSDTYPRTGFLKEGTTSFSIIHIFKNKVSLCGVPIPQSESFLDNKFVACAVGMNLQYVECVECKSKAKEILIAEKQKEIEKIKQS